MDTTSTCSSNQSSASSCPITLVSRVFSQADITPETLLYRMSSNALALPLQVGQSVWVQTGHDQHEVGTVVKLGCSRTIVAATSDDDDDISDQIVSDGIMVTLNVGNSKAIYDPAQLRLFDQEAKRASRRSGPHSSATKTSRAAARSAVTPSPLRLTTSAKSDEDKKPAAKRKSREQQPTLMTAKPPVKKKAAPKSRVGPRFGPRKEESEIESGNEEDEEGDDGAPRRKAATKVVHKKGPAAVAAKPSAQGTKRKVIEIASSGSEEEEVCRGDEESDNDEDDSVEVILPPAANHVADNDDSAADDDDEDKPFFVDYAPTGRATCRRCDEIITKGSCRISHVPLFRGKPGYRIYRHLECALFGEDIHCVQDVGGWRSLTTEDLETLALQVEASKIEIEEENREISPDELIQAAFTGETRMSPPGLTATLLPFQVEGLSWMRHQEVNEDVKGGILADEMGGKTIQTIATILDNRPILQHAKPGSKHPPGAADLKFRQREDVLWTTAVDEWNHEMAMNNVPKKSHPKKHACKRAGTLVVCPVIALSQWKTEIEKFAEPGTLTVGTYHGQNRASEMPLDMICKYDIVLTTYQVIESDFRKMVSPNKVACPNCGAKFKIDKLRVHLKYFCGEGAQRTEAQARQRRSGERHEGDVDDGGNGSSGKRGGKKKAKLEKKSFTMPCPTKVRVRVASQGDYESDSELSVLSDAKPAAKRQVRSASTNASNRMKALAKDWELGPRSGTDSAFDDESGDSDSEGSDDGIVSERRHDVKVCSTKLVVPAKPVCEGSEDDAGDDDSVDEAVLRQQKEMEKFAVAKRGTKRGPVTKRAKKAMSGASKKLAAKKKLTGKKKIKKKFDDEEPSSSDDSDDDDGDPMADINMNKLLNEAMAGATFSPLHAFNWWRVVLDEAHYIKSRSSQTAAAAFALTSVHRWALSGTPLQNRVGELYSLIRFLRLDPMASYFCRQKGCSCKSLHYRIKAGQCQDCGHRAFTHYAHFNRYVLNPIQREGYTGDGRRAMFKLKEQVLDKCLLRRTKETRAADLNLPPRIVKIRAVRLHPVEQDFYNALYTQTKSSFDDYVTSGTLLNNYAHIFDLLTRLRQAVNHPYMIVYSHRAMKKLRDAGQQPTVANGSAECAICDEPFTERITSSCCNAGFCRACVIEYLSGTGEDSANCPSCERPFTIDLNQKSSDATDDGILAAPTRSSPSDPTLKELTHVATGSILRRINLAEFATSSKIEVLVQELIEMRQKRPGSKALVFSQFVNMLDLIRWRLHSDPCLQDLGLGVKIIHGGMDVKSRDEALADFRENNDCRVLLMSLKAAGVALNLTVASECYLMDLWWNPAAEFQAIDRTHRLGQFRPIRAVRLVAEGTVEERVLQLQEKKRLVFDGTVGRDAASLKMLTMNDMVNLFSHG